LLKTLNLGILAHVDAGKTSLTERLLHSAGVIDEIGSVDDGNTQTDSMALERQRGITIKAAVVSFALDDITVNIIDTPGHPDFIAEVERVLSVLDGAVLVISAVEGIQPQTRVLMRVLQRLNIPALIFVNKIDRRGAQGTELLRAIEAKLSARVIAMGSPDATPYGEADADFTKPRIDALADDEEFLTAYVKDESAASYGNIRERLAAQTAQAVVHPVYFGSAITGTGIEALISGIRELLPLSKGDVDGPPRGTVFKVERGAAGEKIAYVRMFDGTVRVRDRLDAEKVTAISVIGEPGHHDAVRAGQIAKLWGLGGVRIGDAIGFEAKEEHFFSPPTLETVVVPRYRADKGALYVALTQLAEQDPLINLRHDDLRQETTISLYGEVQKEVIQATLAGEYGVAVDFRETTTICIERPNATGAAVEVIKGEGNPFLAKIGLRVDPAPVNSGVQFRLEIEPGTLPIAFRKAIEETVYEALQQGIHGWQVIDCVVALTHSGYWPRQSKMHAGFDKSMSSTAGDFRNLTPLVLMTALTRAGTGVFEPVSRFRLDIPADSYRAVLPVLTDCRAIPQTSVPQGPSYVIEGEIPAAEVAGFERLLPGLTGGDGVLECTFAHYQKVSGPLPSRARWDHNPLNRREYLLHIQRRV
jgi:ribosomal protection tetracycline resistance protein